jgi:hypothetical protein
MEILQTATVENITLSVNDRWDIGNNVIIVLKELFEIDGMIYMSTITENQPMVSIKISPNSEEKITPNRYINSAEMWVKKNTHLFS